MTVGRNSRVRVWLRGGTLAHELSQSGVISDATFLAGVAARAARIRAWIDGVVAELGTATASPKGRGLMSGIAFADHGLAGRIAAEAFRQRLLIETSGAHSEVLKLLPPLTIEEDVLEEGLQRLRRAIAAVIAPEHLRSAA